MCVALLEVPIQPSKRLLKKWGKVGGVGCAVGIMRLLYSFTVAGVIVFIYSGRGLGLK